MQRDRLRLGDGAAAAELPLSGAALLQVWESSAGEPSPARALALLHSAVVTLSAEDAATLSLAERDQALVALHLCNFGAAFPATASCESCGERLEFTLPAEQVAANLAAADRETTLTQDGVTLRLRLANTRDTLDAATAPDLETARLLLLERCTRATDDKGRGVAVPPALRAAGLDRLDAMHEAVETSVTLTCPACGTPQLIHLDIADFVCAEIHHAARRLLDDVHELAWAYGWSEAAILGISAARRRAYLERARG